LFRTLVRRPGDRQTGLFEDLGRDHLSLGAKLLDTETLRESARRIDRQAQDAFAVSRSP
jgi:hypothetical protein